MNRAVSTLRRASLSVVAVGLVGAAFAISLVLPCRAQGSTFEGPALVDGGAANIANPYGGRYVYREASKGDGRRPGRFLLGQRSPLRDEYTLFSAEEEDALWHLRDHLLHPELPVAARRIARREPVAPKIDWPKVVLQGEKTCVPALAFSEAPDWRDHLVCWAKEARRVE